jgi:hypothetical protein
MGPTELKMQHTIHLEGEAGHLPRPYPALPSKDTYCGFNFLFRRVHYYSLNTLYNNFCGTIDRLRIGTCVLLSSSYSLFIQINK